MKALKSLFDRVDVLVERVLSRFGGSVKRRQLENIQTRISELIGNQCLSMHKIYDQSINARPYFYLGKNWALTRLSIGLPFFVNTDDRGISPWIIMGGTWENFVDDIMQELLHANDVCLDIGANLGYYTVKMGHKVGPNGRVFAFEPNPEIYPFLEQNVLINGFSGFVKAFPNGVGAAAGSGSMVFDYRNMGGGCISPNVNGDVRIIALDDLPEIPEKVDFIKIDIEGMEPAALAGMPKLLKRNGDCIIITEFSHHAWKGYGDPASQLLELAGDRSIFWIAHNGTFSRPLNDWKSDVQHVSYALIIGENNKRFPSISHRLR